MISHFPPSSKANHGWDSSASLQPLIPCLYSHSAGTAQSAVPETTIRNHREEIETTGFIETSMADSGKYSMGGAHFILGPMPLSHDKLKKAKLTFPRRQNRGRGGLVRTVDRPKDRATMMRKTLPIADGKSKDFLCNSSFFALPKGPV
jgi:hypothetical protein